MLQELNLSGNSELDMETFPENLDILKKLNITSCCVSDLSFLKNVALLKHLELSNNLIRLETIPQNFNHLQRLRLISCGLNYQGWNSFLF